jgi:predicted CopG family antitoxin
MLNIIKIVHYVMHATKRIPVSEETWKELARMKEAGQTYDVLLQDLIEEKKKNRLEKDIAEWEKDESVEFSFRY